MDTKTKATIAVGEKIVTFEGPEEFVERQVARFMHHDESSDTGTHSESPKPQPPAEANAMESEAKLVERKKPQGHPEVVAVLAFALAERGQKEFSADDIRRAYIRAHVKPPKVVAQAIRDAKNNCEYVIVGSKPGTYKLSDYGDTTVRFDLPRHREGN